MDEHDGLEKLRAEFGAGSIGKLPKISCSACSKAQSKVCDRHTKGRCDVCSNWITSGHIHLDYVGHAAVTDRLLNVDPAWFWEPVAFDADGTPLIQRGPKEARMWIRLTVCGVTRLGVGIVEVGKFELEKQLISDALRNAAMRFGVALDLWSKEDLEGTQLEEPAAPPSDAVEADTPDAAPAPLRSVATSNPDAVDLATGEILDIDAMKVKELHDELAARGLDAGGSIAEMRDRLREAVAA